MDLSGITPLIWLILSMILSTILVASGSLFSARLYHRRRIWLYLSICITRTVSACPTCSLASSPRDLWTSFWIWAVDTFSCSAICRTDAPATFAWRTRNLLCCRAIASPFCLGIVEDLRQVLAHSSRHQGRDAVSYIFIFTLLYLKILCEALQDLCFLNGDITNINAFLETRRTY